MACKDNLTDITSRAMDQEGREERQKETEDVGETYRAKGRITTDSASSSQFLVFYKTRSSKATRNVDCKEYPPTSLTLALPLGRFPGSTTRRWQSPNSLPIEKEGENPLGGGRSHAREKNPEKAAVG